MADTSAATTTILHRGPNNDAVHLTLRKVGISVTIVDVSAEFVLRHTFSNDQDIATGQAKYVVPMPASAAACAFEMRSSDGGFLIGVAKERDQAKAEFDAAVATGQEAALVTWACDDRSIPPRATVTTRLTCVMVLMDNASASEVRFQLPMAIGAMRYGTPPLQMQDAASASSGTRLRIEAFIQTAGELVDVSSPSHGKDLNLRSYKTHYGRDSHRRWTGRVESESFLESDFVLVIQAEKMDRSRAFAELDKARGTVAIQLAVVPKYNIESMANQEYLFLVDRSGSMGQENRMEAAKTALSYLLKALPAYAGVSFNIYSFGTTCDAMWVDHRTYDETSGAEAARHVNAMDANYSGTEIESALRKVFGERDRTIPTAVFVLTDGEAYGSDNPIAAVAQAVRASSREAPVRVFTIGVGKTVSTAMCEGIARAGNGICFLAVDHTEILSKCFKLMLAGMHRVADNVTIDWGLDSHHSSPTDPRTWSVQQTPPSIEKLYSNQRQVVYAILKTKTIPKRVVLKGRIGGTGNVLEIPVSVQIFKKYSSGDGDGLPIHCLAARNMISDLREARTNPPLMENTSLEERKKAETVRLGVAYQLVSEFTSFVAVYKGARWRARRLRSGQHSRIDTTVVQAYTWGDYAGMAVDAITSIFNLVWESSRSSEPPRTMPGGMPSQSSSRPSTPMQDANVTGSDQDDDDEDGRWDRDGDGDGGGSDGESVWSHSTMSTLMSDSDDLDEPRPLRRRRVEPPLPQDNRSPSPNVHLLRQQGADRPQVAASPQLEPKVAQLIGLQSFNGSFARSAELESIVGQKAMDENTLGVEENLWATALALEFIKKTMIGQPDLLEAMCAKMLEYLGTKMRERELNRLIKRAERAIA
ncbi:hypothetical protein FA95DRAFT_1497300 [Auriscalpium vulgare]|uniref:Uncharacterized protein n=1 Tax=Auriscalpium vulgare TaxID=40419 RepID=A0ACB8RL26_9AGAM|nr:hypothetical protein FA95DRAFT_1497300 [Auriscalpium vulgare]